jgi:hypothetical protein
MDMCTPYQVYSMIFYFFITFLFVIRQSFNEAVD